jgi:hypothetical protein
LNDFDGKINVCLFSPPTFMTTSGFKKFRDDVLSMFRFEKGFLMDSSNFADVKSWGLSFSILSSKK